MKTILRGERFFINVAICMLAICITAVGASAQGIQNGAGEAWFALRMEDLSDNLSSDEASGGFSFQANGQLLMVLETAAAPGVAVAMPVGTWSAEGNSVTIRAKNPDNTEISATATFSISGDKLRIKGFPDNEREAEWIKRTGLRWMLMPGPQ